MSVFLIPHDLAGDRVDAAAARVTGHSRSRIEDLISSGGLVLDGVPVTKPSQRVVGGDLLELVAEPKPVTVSVGPRTAAGMGIVHDDAHIVVVDKPAGVAAHPSLGWDGPSVT